jgi:hypothetical protein
MKTPRITSDHFDHYREHGYAIVEGFLTTGELAKAREELRVEMPEWVEYCDDPTLPRPEGGQYNFVPGRGASRFPFKGKTLNGISLHPELRQFARDMAGGNEVFCEQANLNVKCKGHPRDADQAMHCDYGNHTLAYPPDLPEYWQTAYIIYYTDVDLDHAPTAVGSSRHYPESLRWPAHYAREERPDLYDNEVKVTVPAGSLLAYSMRTFHRGTPFLKDVGRIVQFITYAPAAWKWLGIVGWSVEAIRPEFRNWIESATPEERTTMGFPPPRHSYWTDETRKGVSARYPRMDMTPYQ